MYNNIAMFMGINACRNINPNLIKNPQYNLHLMSRALHYHSPPYDGSRPDYTNDHETFLRNNKPLEMCLGSGSLTSKPGPCVRAPMGVESYTMNRGGKCQGNVT